MHYHKNALTQWVYEKLSSSSNPETMNLLVELYEDFNLQEVDTRQITPSDIVGMWEELKTKDMVKGTPWVEVDGEWKYSSDGTRL